jgi:hypothetical protein
LNFFTLAFFLPIYFVFLFIKQSIVLVNKKIPTHLDRDFKCIYKNPIIFAVGIEPTRSNNQQLPGLLRLPFRHAAIIYQQKLINSSPLKKIPGSVLLSHTVARAVPSTQRGLTSVFGMGTGVSLSPRPPENFSRKKIFGY